jgi:hypothetical protein
MAELSDHIWYAKEADFKRLLRWSSLAVQGRIQASEGHLRFFGQGGDVVLHDVRRVFLARRPIPWLGLAVDNLLIFLFFVSGLSTFTLDEPITYAFWLLINVVFVFWLWRIRWVAVEYIDEEGQLRRAYFSDGSAFGRGRALSGSDRLCHSLQEALQN